jgi:hypothetical protein
VCGRSAAIELGRWDDALELNADVLESMSNRHASATEIAPIRFSDYGPLLRLGRTDEALGLLQGCRQVFQDAHDTQALGKVFSALADTEYQRGHGDTALRLERDALRYKYLAGDVPGITRSYHNLGNYFHKHVREAAPAIASHLASALIEVLSGTDDDGQSARPAAIDLYAFGSAATPPHDVDGLCDRLADIPGTDLPRLIAALSPDPETAERVLRDLIAQALELAATLVAGTPESPGDSEPAQ